MGNTIDIKVNGNHLSKYGNRAGVRGEGNVTYLRIAFDDTWSGYAKHVTFWNAKGTNPVTLPLTADMLEDIANSTNIYLCPIPWEALTEGGLLTFIIDGYTDGKRKRTVSDELEVLHAPLTEGSGEAQDPTPTEAERLQAQIDGILDVIATEVIGASAHALNAELSRKAAETHEGNAAEWARQAQASADDALLSENAAAGHEAAAAGHAADAQAWAEAAKAIGKYTSEALDDLKTIGNYTWLAAEGNPFGAVSGALYLIAVDVGRYGENLVVVQTATQAYGWAGPTTGTTFKRIFFGDVWSAWRSDKPGASDVGAFPVGVLSLYDLNAAPEGTYTCHDCLNGPANNTVGLLICKVYDGNYIWQMYHSYAHKKTFQRYCDGAVWAAWEEVYTSRNIYELRDALKAIW